MTGPPAADAGAGPMLRRWRARRRASQMNVALAVGVSPRHLSFIETGRSRPSAAMLLALAEYLAMPLRERNRALLAAGHAPRYAERGLEAPAMVGVRAALQRLLDAHDPYPGVVLDRQWNAVLANRAAADLAALVPEPLRTPAFNVFRVCLHPDALAPHTLNFVEWATYLLGTLQRAASNTGDAGLHALEQEVLSYPNVKALPRGADRAAASRNALLVPCELALPMGRLSLFTTLTTFGTPLDITLEELCVELFYPADEASEALLRGAAR
jgi:transcriptional regulator with XRE-family HTH domain